MTAEQSREDHDRVTAWVRASELRSTDKTEAHAVYALRLPLAAPVTPNVEVRPL